MKKKEQPINHCKQCYYAACCYERGRGVACTSYKNKISDYYGK